MTSTDPLLLGSYDYRLVVLSVVISCMAAYAALDLGGRVTSARGAARMLWLTGGATAMGIGIWSMHYIGMLAFHLGVPIQYDWPTVLLSLLAAIVASGIALYVVSGPKLGAPRAIVGSVFMGAGIAAMHYIGMAAMRIAAMCHFSPPIVSLSVLLAIVISFIALWLTFHLRGDVPPWGWKKVASALVMGAAIPVMHYTGMAAASFTSAPLDERDLLHAVSVSSLGTTAIVGGTIMTLLLALVSSMADRQFAIQVRGRQQAEAARGLLEAQLQQSQKMEAIGQLAAGVAHDFNNLLTVIIGFSELTLDRLEPEHPSRADVQQSLVAARSAHAVTRQLLAFSRKQILRPEFLDLNTIIGRLEGLLRRAVGESVQLRLSLTAPLGIVSADPGQIEQMLMNLAVNARDAMPSGGVLTIETHNVTPDRHMDNASEGRATGRHVKVAVTDTGVGIPAEARDRLFEPFFTTKARGKGTGLGLATVYGIVRQSGGHISVESEPGHGATFSVYFPETDRAVVTVRPAPEQAATAGGTETILLVEDQAEVASVMRATLARQGYHVVDASSAEEALVVADAHTEPIHLLLTDVVMPGMNGRDLARRLVDKRPAIRVLYTSGYTDHAIVQHGVIEGGLAFIQKPFSPDDLLRKVRETFDAAR